jgi:hypothetical protein
MFRPMIFAFMFAAALAGSALAQDEKIPRTISLTGHGEVRVAPDMASVTIGVASQADTAQEALAANTAAMNAVMNALKAAGIAARDIQTSNFSVQPRYDYDNAQPPRLAGYDVSNTVNVTVRDLASLGGLLDRMVQAGSNQIHGIAFEVSKPELAQDNARNSAVADAKRKAALYAQALSVQLGDVLSVSEQVPGPPIPVLRQPMRAEAVAADVPVSPGEQKLSVDVTIVWEIK